MSEGVNSLESRLHEWLELQKALYLSIDKTPDPFPNMTAKQAALEGVTRSFNEINSILSVFGKKVDHS